MKTYQISFYDAATSTRFSDLGDSYFAIVEAASSVQASGKGWSLSRTLGPKAKPGKISWAELSQAEIDFSAKFLQRDTLYKTVKHYV